MYNDLQKVNFPFNRDFLMASIEVEYQTYNILFICFNSYSNIIFKMLNETKFKILLYLCKYCVDFSM